jgi:hypothetical protein
MQSRKAGRKEARRGEKIEILFLFCALGYDCENRLSM